MTNFRVFMSFESLSNKRFSETPASLTVYRSSPLTKARIVVVERWIVTQVFQQRCEAGHSVTWAPILNGIGATPKVNLKTLEKLGKFDKNAHTMWDRLEKFIEFFSGDEPMETIVGLAVTLLPVYIFTPPMIGSILTESPRNFTLIAVTGWFLMITSAYQLCQRAYVKDQPEGFGSLILWLTSAVGFTPASFALSYLCWRSGNGNVVPIIMLLEAGILWGARSSWQNYRDLD